MQKKILIIEDDPIVAQLARRMVEKQGCVTEIAIDGAEGIEKIPVFQPDAILLDLMMPKVNGIDVLQWIRAHDDLRNLPVIVVTNAAVPALIDQAVQAGATHILDKSKLNPVSMTELLRGVLHAQSGTFAG